MKNSSLDQAQQLLQDAWPSMSKRVGDILQLMISHAVDQRMALEKLCGDVGHKFFDLGNGRVTCERCHADCGAAPALTAKPPEPAAAQTAPARSYPCACGCGEDIGSGSVIQCTFADCGAIVKLAPNHYDRHLTGWSLSTAR